MSKYVFIGPKNPQTGKPFDLAESDYSTLRKDSDSSAVVMKSGVPTEVPEALEFRVKNNPNFKLVSGGEKPEHNPPVVEPRVEPRHELHLKDQHKK